MPAKYIAETMPEDIKNELLANYMSLPYWKLDDHLEWLKEKGVNIGRSSLHRWLLAKKEQLASNAEQTDIEQQSNELIRLFCLDAAVKCTPDGSGINELLDTAEILVKWIKSKP